MSGKTLHNIEETISSLKFGFKEIDEKRKQKLEEVALYISAQKTNGNEVELTFICTHNSRRSHMSQIWAQTAAAHYGISGISCYSGGTEATSFNPRAVEALKKQGFEIEKTDSENNPVYLVEFSKETNPLKCFSKKYSDEFNPRKNFAALMTCSDADDACPIVFGAEARFSIPYEDPKTFDGTEQETEKYLERARQIGSEMLYMFSKVN